MKKQFNNIKMGKLNLLWINFIGLISFILLTSPCSAIDNLESEKKIISDAVMKDSPGYEKSNIRLDLVGSEFKEKIRIYEVTYFDKKNKDVYTFCLAIDNSYRVYKYEKNNEDLDYILDNLVQWDEKNRVYWEFIVKKIICPFYIYNENIIVINNLKELLALSITDNEEKIAQKYKDHNFSFNYIDVDSSKFAIEIWVASEITGNFELWRFEFSRKNKKVEIKKKELEKSVIIARYSWKKYQSNQ